MSTTDKNTNNSNINAFLKTIQRGLGTAGDSPYNKLPNNKSFDTSAGWAFPTGEARAGAYLLLKAVWDSYASAFKLTDFSEKNQDKAAINIIKEAGANADIINGEFDKAMAKCKNKWPQLPNGSSTTSGSVPITILRDYYKANGGTIASTEPTTNAGDTTGAENTPAPSGNEATGASPDQTSTSKPDEKDNNTPPASTNVSDSIVNIFPATIKPPIIEFEIPNREEAEDYMRSGVGYMPFIWYNAYQISEADISYFTLYNEGVVPAIKIIFKDTLNLLKDRGFPLDDTKLTLYLNPKSGQLKPIFLQFKLMNLSISGEQYILHGILNVNQLYINKSVSYKSQSSLQVLQAISKEVGLGFNTNVNSTDDMMTWINPLLPQYDLINDILEHSYISDASYLMGYIDYYYNFNYIDVEKELNRNIDEQMGVTSIGFDEILKMGENTPVSNSLLTNDGSMENSNSYFNQYRIINNSTDVSLKNGYRTTVKYYDEVAKNILIFDVDSITSDGSKTIILKGAPQDETWYKENRTNMYIGKMDTSNVHKNFNYAVAQNDKNLTDLEKIGLEIEMGVPNYNLYRFQKIKVIITNDTTTPSQTMVNNRLSGDWLIIHIGYRYAEGVLTQVVMLVKKELELSSTEFANEEFKTGRNYSSQGRNYDNLKNPPDLSQLPDDAPKPAPIDPTTDADINWLIACVIDEAGNQGADGQAAVAQVVINRRAQKYIGNPPNPEWGNTFKAYVLAKGAFSGFSHEMIGGKYTRVAKGFDQIEKRGLGKIQKYMKEKRWNTVKEVVNQVLAGTYKSTSFNPIKNNKNAVQYGNWGIVSKPSWAKDQSFLTKIKDHWFYATDRLGRSLNA